MSPGRKEKKGLSALEHRILSGLRKSGLEGASVLVLVSGGVDSVVAFHTLWKLRQVANLKIRLSHIHHGQAQGALGEFRDQSWQLVRSLADERGVEFVSNADLVESSWAPLPPAMRSEAEWRKFRRQCALKWRQPAEWIATGHHADDLLETRLIRLVRGTGTQGLRSLATAHRPFYRPLLRTARVEILEHAKKEKLAWVEDPTNKDSGRLRNFLRHDWLPRLEEHRKGASASLARSLDLLASLSPTLPTQTLGGAESGELDWAQVLVQHLREQSVETYSATHIEEILKRISNRKPQAFELLGRNWFWDGQKLSWRLIAKG